MPRSSVRDPILHSTPIAELRPTQMTVGYREVEAKRRRWREIDDKDREAFLDSHMIPVLLGPKKRRYVIDHHHLARALQEEGVASVFTFVVADLHHLEKDAFWVVADHRAWVHPYDADGVRRDVGDLPKSIEDLADDPFRSLAGELRRAGGFAKDTTPFSEFLWADFLRRHIKRKDVKQDFSDALEEALSLARSKAAVYLPGWCGPHED
ncbi:ParB-like protein [Methylobacterium sp. 17Sr1-1]|uniref:ParB-like protein n=1 Tax=Methylobacterium sp. 17Sr1-1 TaxID=2202826 RepID=UPI000D6FEED4|nr:ParB-like protein [Methylobacterium sp. 17Sr1-1]AWN55326.1 chromosome partitioning protein ParB [Methylobacterium sp. 17Sr1-1]